jgi:PAS domain S-box-containing protein
MLEVDHPRIRKAWNWVEALVAVLILAAIVFLWYNFRTSESRHVRRMTQLAAASVIADILGEINSPASLSSSMRQLWESAEEPSNEFSQSTARLYIKRYRSCAAVQWIDSAATPRWTIAQVGDEDLHDLDSIPQAPRDAVLKEAVDTRKTAFSKTIHMPDGDRLTLMAIAVFRGSELRGQILTVFHTREFVHDLLEEFSGLGYGLTVSEDGEELFSWPGSYWRDAQEWVEDADVNLSGISWHLQVFPKPEMLQALKSRSSDLVLFLEVCMGVLLLVSVRLARTARATTRIVQIANEKVSASQSRLEGILDISPEAIINVSADERITLFNQGAEKIFGHRAEDVLGKQLDVLIPEGFRDQHHSHIHRFTEDSVATRNMCNRRPVFGLRGDGRQFPAEATVSKLQIGSEIIYTVILRDITERVKAREELVRAYEELDARVRERTEELADANKTLRKLSTRLLTSQDEERRRIARELHDSTAQNLFVLSVDLGSLLQECKDAGPERLKTLTRCVDLAEGSIAELRTLSYLLHPPMLEELGLEPALGWLVDGFSKRSGIPTTLDFDPCLGRLTPDAELALFRIIQESLTNVHRHARSSTASVSLRRDATVVTLEVRDMGRGTRRGEQTPSASAIVTPGVGIAGMKERIRHLGGHLEIKAANPGTLVTASLPLAETVAFVEEQKVKSSGA